MIQERNTVISMSMNNLIVGQSGGPTAVINSSLYGVVSEGFGSLTVEYQKKYSQVA